MSSMVTASQHIEKEKVHKNDESNVLIFGLRRTLPNIIDQNIMENDILPLLNESLYSLVKAYYHKVDAPDFDVLETNEMKTFFVLSSCPFVVSEQEVDILRARTDEDTLQNILIHYQKDGGQYFLHDTDLSEEECEKISILLGRNNCIISEPVKLEISKLLEPFVEVAHHEVFYAFMNVDITHSFFFEHDNEHVPGIMIIEAFRQFAMACAHTFGSVPESGIQQILSEIHTEFYDFAELSLPLKFKGTAINVKKGRQGYWKRINFTADIIQLEKVLARLSVQGQGIPIDLFDELRETNRNALISNYRFCPHPKLQYRAELMYGDVRVSVVLKSLSSEDFVAIVPQDTEIPDECRFSLVMKGLRPLKGTCRKEKLLGDQNVVFRLRDVSEETQIEWKDALIRRCVVIQ